jgi:hypothetical protein
VRATGFIADTASLPFVVSNLVNIVSADFFGTGFAEYARVMVPVNIVSVAASLTVLYVFYRRDIPRTYDLEDLRAPREAIEDPVTFRAGWWVLALLLVGYFVADPLGVPVSVVTGLGAVALLAVSRGQRVIDTTQVVRGAHWQIVVFSLGMYLVVFGLNNAGLTGYLTALLDGFASYGVVAGSVGTGVTVAALSAVVNNMPTVMIGALSIESAATPGPRAGGDGLRQRHRQRPRPENDPDRQPGDAIVAARVAEEGDQDYLRILLQGRSADHGPRTARYPARLGRLAGDRGLENSVFHEYAAVYGTRTLRRRSTYRKSSETTTIKEPQMYETQCKEAGWERSLPESVGSKEATRTGVHRVTRSLPEEVGR